MVVRLQQNNSGLHFLKNNQQGFTLIEILVALLLVTLVMALAISDPFSNSQELTEQSDDFERAIRFVGDEAALRNSVVRIHFLLDKTPQEYAVEYGPSDSFILPPESELETTTVESKEDQAKQAKMSKEINLKFNKVQEFQESNSIIKESVRIIGIGNSQSQKLKTTGDGAIYAFPSGEKDDAIIILANEQSIISLEINAFNQKIIKNIEKLDTNEQTDLVALQNKKSKEIFEKWIKDR